MADLIHWCAFAGAWLLVIGPLDQAAAEIGGETRQLGELTGKLRSMPQSAPPNPWWWLLPPVAYVLNVRRQREQRRILTAALGPDDRSALAELSDRATAWLFVAGGAFLIAAADTWNLHEAYHWEQWTFWALIVVITGVCVTYTSARARRRRARSRATS